MPNDDTARLDAKLEQFELRVEKIEENHVPRQEVEVRILAHENLLTQMNQKLDKLIEKVDVLVRTDSAHEVRIQVLERDMTDLKTEDTGSKVTAQEERIKTAEREVDTLRTTARNALMAAFGSLIGFAITLIFFILQLVFQNHKP